THLKRWTFQSHVRTEIFHRAVPWSRLVLEHGKIMRDLNLKVADRISGFLTWLLILLLPLAPFNRVFLFATALTLVALLILNRGLYGFFLKRRGPLFLLKAIPLHLFHYWYSAGTFLVCSLVHPFQPAPRQSPTAPSQRV